jgi:BRO family, N-terminal domain
LLCMLEYIMAAKAPPVLFEQKAVRRVWDDLREEWYFSVVDVVALLTDQQDFQVARSYWKKLAQRLRDEGSEVVTNCHQLKMTAADGKMRETDAADLKTLFRIVQIIPSPNAEPVKIWLAKVGYERVEETEDPEKAMDRAMKTYLQKGYSRAWINQRLKSIEVRKELTDEWENAGVKEGMEFAILTDEITKAWAGISTKQYKQTKGLKKENLRDNMTNLELILNMLAEASTTEISKTEKPAGLKESKVVARKGGAIAGNARKEIEQKSGKKVISNSRFSGGKIKVVH